MGAADIIAIATAVIAALSLGVAALQFLDGRRRKRTEAEQLAAQEERLRTALTAATIAANSADSIVQRAKEKDVTIAELQNMGRLLRGTLTVLANQLNDEQRAVAARASASPFMSIQGEDLEDGQGSRS
jgi:uncharacterized protein HemX